MTILSHGACAAASVRALGMPGSTQRAAALVQCINNKDECVRWVVRKGADEVKEEIFFH